MVQQCAAGSSRALLPDTNTCRSYFWTSRTAAAAPRGQRSDPRTSPAAARAFQNVKGLRDKKRPLMNKGLLLALDVSGGAAQTRGAAPSPGGTALTTFHRSLTRESTLRMSACSVPPLIPPADRGTLLSSLPSPQTGPDI